MKVKIKNIIYSSEMEPIMVILNNGERKQIAEMDPGSFGKYCQFPEGMAIKEIEKFMEKGKAL